MTPELESLLTAFIESIQVDDPESLESAVAPWLDAQDVITEFSTYQSEILSEYDFDDVASIKETEFDDTGSPFDEIESDMELPGSVNSENFKHWIDVQFIFEEDGEGMEPVIEFSVAIVEHDGDLSVGAYKFSEEE